MIINPPSNPAVSKFLAQNKIAPGRDVLGWRHMFGVLAPSTNTIVEPDIHAMAVKGVTTHMARIHITDPDISSDAKMEALLLQIRDEILRSIDLVKTAKVDSLVMGMSLETFWGGLEGNKAFVKRLEDYSGLKVNSGAQACAKALNMLNVKKVAVLTPYQPIGDLNVRKFFADLEIEVVALKGLRCPTATSIAQVSPDAIRDALVDLAVPDAQAIVQVGTNLSMMRMADEAERWLKRPVIAINAATWWSALRNADIHDQIEGCGILFREL